ncbi:MAG: LamG domain-containing protein [Proteobacteria bacterium]|nr:LamG domain-containing protein [Pseudomonadota bacterium]
MGTDISTDTHELVWEARSGQEFNGTISIGDGQPGNSGRFTVIGQPAEIGANIYLYGGTLDIDVTTLVTGNIIHQASSAIDVSGDAQLTYQGEPLEVKALTLTLKGHGDIANTSPVQLNASPSILKISNNEGTLSKLDILFSGSNSEIRVNSNSNFTLSTLTTAESFAIDTSSDSTIRISEPFEVPENKQVSAAGEGNIIFPHVTIKTGAVYDHQDTVVTTWDGMFLSGMFNGETSTFTLTGDVTGDGTFNVRNSQIDISGDVDVLLTGMNSLQSDNNTTWNISKGDLTWNGLGGDLNGAVDVSTDLALRLIENQATIGANLALQGTLFLDVTADVSGDIQLGIAPGIVFQNNTGLDIEKPLTIQSGTDLSVSGIGELKCQDLNLSVDATVDISETDVVLEKSPIIDGSLLLSSSNIFVRETANEISGTGQLILQNGAMVLQRNFKVSDFKVSADKNMEWRIEDNNTLTWDTGDELAADKILIGDNGGLALLNGSGDVSADIIFMNAQLEFLDSTILKGDINFDDPADPDATVDIIVASDKTLTYKGSSFNLSRKNVVLSGGGNISNDELQTNWFLLNNNGSHLTFASDNGRLTNVKVDSVSSNSEISVEKNFTINHLLLEKELTIYIADGQVLTIDTTLDVGEGATLDVRGSGTLNVKNNFVVQGNVLVSGGILQVENPVNVSSTGNIKLTGGGFKQANGDSLQIKGDGTLDLTSQSLDLNGDLKVFTSIESDATTDIKTNGYILEWHPIEGNTLRGKILIGNDGVFKIIDTKADISADIYLDGGMLDIDVTTDVTGSIYHLASSTIDIDSGYSLNYFGNDISVDALTLSLAGNGTMANEQTIVLNDSSSKLKLASGGRLHKATAKADSYIFVPFGADYSISSLIINQPLTVDISTDAALSIEQSLEVPSDTSFVAKGEGALHLNALTVDGTGDIGESIDLKIKNNVEVGSTGYLLADKSSLLFYSSGDSMISGSGNVDLQESRISLDSGSNLDLTLDASANLSSDTNTRWSVYKNSFTWNGYGGVLKGTIDVSADSVDYGVFHLKDNPATVDAVLNLEGQLKVDVSADMLGSIQIKSDRSSIDLSTDTELLIRQRLTIPDGRELSIQGMGVTELFETLKVEGSGLLKANNTHVRLHNTPDISSDIELRGSTLFFAGNADILAGEGELNLYMSDIVLERNVDINDFDISTDGNNDWLIGNGATLTWNSTQELTGNQVDIGIGSELILTKNPVIVSSGIIFKGGKLSSDASSDIIGSISLHDLGEIDVGAGASITYSGEIISLAGKRLTLSGQGDFKNNNATTNWIQLDTAGSQLILNGSGGRVSNVKANNSDTNKLIRAENDFTIEQLVVESNLDIYIEPFKTLTIDATLDIQPGADLTLSGGGTLNVKKAFDVEGSVNIGTNTVLLQQGVTIENTGEVNVNNGKITQPDGQTINIEGNGKLDLTSQSLDLNGDLKVFTSIESDATTDIKTNGYILEWYPVEGNTLHGEIFVGSDGVFKIIDTKADISADIYLDGGMLDIDVTTDVTGSIYHRASSTIDIDSGYSLNYFGNDISVDALTLSLAGNGTMANDQPVVLDENSGKLRFLADGSMKKTRIDATTDSRIEVGGEYFVEQLIVNQPLTIDISPDSMLSIAQPLTIDSTASLDVIGDGSIKLNSINLDSTFNMTAGQVIILSGNLDASSDGILTAKNVSVILNSASDVHFTGDGAMDFTGSTIQMNNNLYLNLDSAGDLTSDSTHWRNNGKILSWNGNGGSLQGQIDLSSDATLLIHETPSIIGANINLYEGHIDIDTTTDVLGTLTSSTEFDASMDVQLGTTLNLNQDLNIDSKNFALSGAGRVIANNLVVDGSTNINQTSLELYHNLTVNKSLIINDGSLSLDGSADSISGLGPVTIGLNNLNVDFRNDVSVSVDISSDGSTNWDLHGNTLRWNVDSDLNGTGIVLGSQGTLSINRAINISSPMDISSGILDINQDVTLFGSLVPLVSDTTIDVSHDAYLDYSGDELKIGANTLNLNNSGVIENVNDFDLNGSDSVLHLTGQDGMLGKAKFTADSSPDHGIIVDDDYVIQQLTLDGALGRVKVAAGKTLIIGDQLIAQNGTNKLIKDPSNDGTIILHEVVLEGHLEIGEGFTLAPDATLYVKQNATLTVNSDLYFNDGIIVDNGAVLTITGGDHTVTFAGGYNLSGSGQVDVSGDVNVEIESSQVDLSELSRTGKPGTGTINPSKNGALDVLSFSATSKNQEIDLKWVFQDDTYKYVRIIRSANGYPDATSDPTLVYDGTSDNYTDGVQNGISFYYTAFAHDGSGDYAPGVHAMASATIIPDGLIGYYMLGAEDCTNDLLLDSCGLGSHGLCQGSLNPVQDATGDPTGALEFNGLESSAEIDNPYLEVSSIDSDTAADDFTISFWIRTSQTGGDPSADWFDNSNFPIIDGKIGVDQNDFGIALANNRIVFGIGFGNSTFNIASKTIDADWHHIGVTRDYNTGLMQLYLDGKLDATGDGPIHADLNSPSFLGIGRSPFGNTYFEGRLDDIRFYNRVLIESEIESLYENTP